MVMEDRPMETKDELMKNTAEDMDLPVPSVSSSPPRYYRRQLHIDHGNLWVLSYPLVLLSLSLLWQNPSWLRKKIKKRMEKKSTDKRQNIRLGMQRAPLRGEKRRLVNLAEWC